MIDLLNLVFDPIDGEQIRCNPLHGTRGERIELCARDTNRTILLPKFIDERKGGSLLGEIDSGMDEGTHPCPFKPRCMSMCRTPKPWVRGCPGSQFSRVRTALLIGCFNDRTLIHEPCRCDTARSAKRLLRGGKIDEISPHSIQVKHIDSRVAFSIIGPHRLRHERKPLWIGPDRLFGTAK